MDKLLSLSKVAELLGIDISAVTGLLDAGKLKGMMQGGEQMVDPGSLVNLVSSDDKFAGVRGKLGDLGIDMPGMPDAPDMPKVDMPDMPKADMPDVNMPKADMPDMPKVDVPDVNMPKADMPDMPRAKVPTPDAPSGGFKAWWLLPLILVGGLLFWLATRGGDDAGTGNEGAAGSGEVMEAGDCSDDTVFCVGLVTDVGEIDDKSFNQSAWEGVKMAQGDIGSTQIKFIETQDTKDYATNIGLFADDDYDAIITVGFALANATIDAAKAHPDIDFIGVDQFHDGSMPNVVGLLFPEDKAGFLAGALAAMMSESNTIGQVLGTNLVPPVVAFGEGFENGARYISPDVEILTTYHPGGVEVAFTDPEWGAATAKQAIDSGADVIFGAGGKTGNGALIEVASQGGSTYCIGVDTDQWQTVPEAHPCLITSAMKLIDSGVHDLLQQSAAGDFQAGGNYFGSVGLAPFHDFDSKISSDIKAELDKIDAGLSDGSISTGYTP